jgi:hypothetical protein
MLWRHISLFCRCAVHSTPAQQVGNLKERKNEAVPEELGKMGYIQP